MNRNRMTRLGLERLEVRDVPSASPLLPPALDAVLGAAPQEPARVTLREVMVTSATGAPATQGEGVVVGAAPQEPSASNLKMILSGNNAREEEARRFRLEPEATAVVVGAAPEETARVTLREVMVTSATGAPASQGEGTVLGAAPEETARVTLREVMVTSATGARDHAPQNGDAVLGAAPQEQARVTLREVMVTS